MNKPQTITVIPENPTDISFLKIVFDDRLDIDEGEKMPSTLAKDFEINIYCKDGVKTISEKDNFYRMVKYNLCLSDVTKIELTVFKTYGNELGVYCINYR